MATTPPKPDPAPSRRFTDVDRGEVTTVGAGLRIKGDLVGAGALELAGHLEGSIHVEGLCHLHETARVAGPLTAGDAVIEGQLQGALTVRGKLELRATARVEGDITAASVALAEGCYFEGHIHMEGSGGPGRPLSFHEKRRLGPDKS